MAKKYKVLGIALVAIAIAAGLTLFLSQSEVAVLQPAGEVAHKERALMGTAVLLGMVIIVPVFALTFWIVWRYHEGNAAGLRRYAPERDHSLLLETVWWAVPCLIIAVLSVITWRSSHELDPHRPLAARAAKPLTIQVVALPWKWLFIYPEQGIATVNYLQFPVDTPLNFQLTADAPMNSFWIPRLGGQIYAMPGMSTQLHLIADQPGEYRGSSANLSGKGFAGMHFTARAGSQAAFDRWVEQVHLRSETLDTESYQSLAKPSENQPPASYLAMPGLYDTVVTKYHAPPRDMERRAVESTEPAAAESTGHGAHH